MKLGIDKFLNIFYSILSNDDIDGIDIVDVAEIIKIIYSSDEFGLVATRLDINSFTEEEIMKNKYTYDIDQNGIISFEVPEKNRYKILVENKVDAGFIQQAINKRALAKYLSEKVDENIIMKYDNPDGVYNMPYASLPEYKAESSLFTDGINVGSSLINSKENNTKTRTVKIKNSTFSLFAYYVDGLIDKIEVRGKYNGDYNVLLYESKRILNNIESSFDLIIDESPKVYKYKIH